MRQPVGVGNELLNLAAESFALYRFEQFLPELRLARLLKVLPYKDLSDFSGLQH